MLRQIANSHDSRRPSRRIKQTRPNKSLKIPLSFKIRDINICINRWWFEPGGIYISRKHFHRSFWSVTNDRFNNNKESKCAVFNTNHMCANLFHWGTEIWFLKLQTVSTATNYFFLKTDTQQSLIIISNKRLTSVVVYISVICFLLRLCSPEIVFSSLQSF